ncbi:MAG: metallopeptidase TldD-related protein [Bradymonadia bacterium]
MSDRQVTPKKGYSRTVVRVAAFDSGGAAFKSWIDPALKDIGELIERTIGEVSPSSESPVLGELGASSEPVSYDPRLINYLAGGARFQELAHAMLDNTWHEADRLPGLKEATGSICYRLEQNVIACNDTISTSVAGALETDLALNGGFGERVIQVQAPESMLPTALIGARSWRNCPKTMATSDVGALVGHQRLVFHPRVTERLLRLLVPTLVANQNATYNVGAQVASRSFTLIDDPKLDGLKTSRAFDDRGTPTARLTLLVDGRVSSRFRQPGNGKGCGHRWYTDGDSQRQGLSSLLVNRGEESFHRLFNKAPQRLIINRLGRLEVDLATGHFTAPVEWGIDVRDGRQNRLLPPNQLAITGTLLGSKQAFLGRAKLSHELNDTGTGVLPYVFTEGRVIVNPCAAL